MRSTHQFLTSDGYKILPLLIVIFAVQLHVETVEAFGQQVAVYPNEVHLQGQRDFQQLVVQLTEPDGTTTDVTGQVTMESNDHSIAQLSANRVVPQTDGQCVITVSLNDQRIQVPVFVSRQESDPPISFRREVMPVLSKAGCNSGRCHGAARGKNGFHLSLFGYDSVGDHFRLTRQMSGRRINLAVPEDSLMLRKALGEVTHTGGERFDRQSDHYHTLIRWLREGASLDSTESSDPVSLELFPPRVVMKGQDAKQQFVVIAHYDDGSTRDVTELSVFMSNNEKSLSVAENGVATSGGRGEAWVMARFATITERSQAIVLPKTSPVVDPQSLVADNEIDRLVNAKLAMLRIRPSKLCDDRTFLRRVYIDLVGRTPTIQEYHRFQNDDTDSEAKRKKLIDELLQTDDFVDLWTMKWGELLRIRTANQVSYKALLGFHQWLRRRIADNTKWNEIARDVLIASGGTFENPPTNYYQIESYPQQIAENVAQVFMGMRIQCAKCHNHPFDRWTMDDYYGFGDFFSQIAFKQSRDPREFIIYNRGQGEIKHFVKDRIVDPKFLGGRTPTLKAGVDRRQVLGDWLASEENPFFARHMANMVWAHHFGHGIVEPVDDVRISNPPSNPLLLDYLGEQFAGYDYDIKKLVRDICNSHAYQRSTESNQSNQSDAANYAKAKVRRIRAEVLLDSISQITGTSDRFPRLGDGSALDTDRRWCCQQLFPFNLWTRSAGNGLFVRSRRPAKSVSGIPLVEWRNDQQKIDEGEMLERWLDENLAPEQIIDNIFISCLSREPTALERQNLMRTLTGNPDTVIAELKDIFWAVLNSKEFVFHH